MEKQSMGIETLVPEEVLRQATIAAANQAANVGAILNALRAASTPTEVTFAARRLRTVLFLLATGHDYCGNGATAPARRAAAEAAIAAWPIHPTK